MSSSLLADDVSFDFTFAPNTGYESTFLEAVHAYDPATPHSFAFENVLFEMPYNPGHVRSSSEGSVYSAMSSSVESTPDSSCSRMTTPPPLVPPPCREAPVRCHGPILLPRIRSQDQAIDSVDSPPPAPKRIKRAATPASSSRKRSTSTPVRAAKSKNSKTPLRQTYSGSLASPELVPSYSYSPSPSFSSLVEEPAVTASPASCVQQCTSNCGNDINDINDINDSLYQARRSPSCGLEASPMDKFDLPLYQSMVPFMPGTPDVGTGPGADADVEGILFPPAFAIAPSPPIACPSPPMGLVGTPEPIAHTNLAAYLTMANPAPSLVRSISFPLCDHNTKHFWWDIRQIRAWTDFTASTIISLPGAASLLTCPILAPLLPHPALPANRHPETEASLHRIYSSFYLPKLNAALAAASAGPMQLSVPAWSTAANGMSDLLFTASVAGEVSARVVGLVRSYDRFNTGMRVEGNIKRVEYLRTLAALHHAMRERGCRYGYILTEVELVLVRNGLDEVPDFGFLEIATVQLATAAAADNGSNLPTSIADLVALPLTACLALWGLCMMAGMDVPAPGQVLWRSEIGSSAEGRRRKTLVRDNWMPMPQVAEKRAAKRARGWVFPEEPISRKELGKKGVSY